MKSKQEGQSEVVRQEGQDETALQGETELEQEAQGKTVPEQDKPAPEQDKPAPEQDKPAPEQDKPASEQEAQREVESQILDLTTEPSKTGGPPPPPTAPYSIDKDREQKRGLIALILVGLLAAVFLLSFVGLFTATIELKDLKELLTIILGPLVALVGAATGFYFGEKNKGN